MGARTARLLWCEVARCFVPTRVLTLCSQAMCQLGYLYNREPLLQSLKEHLVDGVPMPPLAKHVVSLKDLTTLQLAPSSSEAAAAPAVAASTGDFRAATHVRYACPLTGAPRRHACLMRRKSCLPFLVCIADFKIARPRAQRALQVCRAAAQRCRGFRSRSEAGAALRATQRVCGSLTRSATGARRGRGAAWRSRTFDAGRHRAERHRRGGGDATP